MLERKPQAARNSGKPQALRPISSSIKDRTASSGLEEERQVLVTLILIVPPAQGPTSPRPQGRCSSTAPACQTKKRQRESQGMMGTAVQPHHALCRLGCPKRRPNYKSRRAPGQSLRFRQPAGSRAWGRPSPAVAADVAAPEPPPPPPPRWGAFRFLFFGIVGRPVPPTLGAQLGSADRAALSTRASVRRAAERRFSG